MDRAEQQVPRPRLVAPPSTSTARRWPAAGPKSSAWPTSSSRKWRAVLEAKRPDIQQEAFGDAMRVIIGGVYQPTLDGSSVKITRSASEDRKSTRLNSSHQIISYAVFCLKKKNINKSQNSAPTVESDAHLLPRD